MIHKKSNFCLTATKCPTNSNLKDTTGMPVYAKTFHRNGCMSFNLNLFLLKNKFKKNNKTNSKYTFMHFSYFITKSLEA